MSVIGYDNMSTYAKRTVLLMLIGVYFGQLTLALPLLAGKKLNHSDFADG